jgi:hypothetical protein
MGYIVYKKNWQYEHPIETVKHKIRNGVTWLGLGRNLISVAFCIVGLSTYFENLHVSHGIIY